jgi:uncharacterized protein (DUF433 family)
MRIVMPNRPDEIRPSLMTATITSYTAEDHMAVRRPAIDGRVVRNPGILGGEPIVRGTRISVRSVVLASREYGAPEGVLQAYPQLTSSDVHDALTYYEAHKPEIDGYIQANIADT